MLALALWTWAGFLLSPFSTHRTASCRPALLNMPALLDPTSKRHDVLCSSLSLPPAASDIYLHLFTQSLFSPSLIVPDSVPSLLLHLCIYETKNLTGTQISSCPWEVEEGRSATQDHPWLHSKLRPAWAGYIRPHSRKGRRRRRE